MEAKKRTLIQKYISEGKKAAAAGNTRAGHAHFVRALKLDPGNVSLHLFAASTCKYREDAEKYLRRALRLQPGAEGVEKAMRWAARLPARPELLSAGKTNQPGSTDGIPRTETIGDGKRKPRKWLLMIPVLLVFLSLLVVFFVKFSGKGDIVDEISEIVFPGGTQAPTISIAQGMPPTWTPDLSGQVSIETAQPVTPVPAVSETLSIAQTPTHDTHGLDWVEKDEVNYPEVLAVYFEDDADEFINERLRVVGEIVDFRSVPVEDELRFLLIIKPVLEMDMEDEPLSSIYVLDLAADDHLVPGMTIEIFGIGGGMIESSENLDGIWYGPLIYGEYYNLQ